MSNVDPKELSTDQRYLMEICNSISIGECGVDLALRNPGCLNHSRWLTTANRILLLYVSDKKPSENRKTLVTYIIRVYAPMWFAIKAHSSCKDEARHLHQMLVKSRYLSPICTRRSLTQSFTATRTSLTGESALGHDHGPSTTYTRVGPATGDEGQSCTSHWTNTEVQGSRRTQLQRRGIF